MYPNLTGPKKQPPDTPTQAREKIRRIAALPWLQVLPVTPALVERALELAQRHEVRRQRFFDMQLAATMLVHGIPTVVTENTRDFAAIPEIYVVNPFA